MRQTYLHRPNLTVEADFSTESPPVFRYLLDATKNDASDKSGTVCAIMQNPSYAGIEIADKSVQVLERVVFEKDLNEFKGIERLIVVNQYAFIQTNDFVGTDGQIGQRNDDAIIKAVNESEIVLIAWGKDNGFVKRQRQILEIIQDAGNKTLLKTRSHPSRVKYEGFIQKYRT